MTNLNIEEYDEVVFKPRHIKCELENNLQNIKAKQKDNEDMIASLIQELRNSHEITQINIKKLKNNYNEKINSLQEEIKIQYVMNKSLSDTVSSLEENLIDYQTLFKGLMIDQGFWGDKFDFDYLREISDFYDKIAYRVWLEGKEAEDPDFGKGGPSRGIWRYYCNRTGDVITSKEPYGGNDLFPIGRKEWIYLEKFNGTNGPRAINKNDYDKHLTSGVQSWYLDNQIRTYANTLPKNYLPDPVINNSYTKFSREVDKQIAEWKVSLYANNPHLQTISHLREKEKRLDILKELAKNGFVN